MNKVSFNQIYSLSKILCQTNYRKMDFLKRKFLTQSTNFDQTLLLLKSVKLVSVKEKSIVLSKIFVKNLRIFQDRGLSKDFLKEYFGAIIFRKESPVYGETKEFLKRFKYAKGGYEFSPTGIECIETANIRNFLIDFGIIYINKLAKKYVLNKKYVLFLFNEQSTFELTNQQFRKILSDKSRIGDMAEKKIIEYEKNRLKGQPELIRKIEHTALKNVMAGYDISSFESDKGKVQPRYIEVKAVSIVDKKFFWSRNELQAAKKFKKKYLLYLLPVKGSGKFDEDKLLIIRDPYKKIYGSNEWKKVEELYSFSMV